MNANITKDLVLAYHLGRVHDPDLRKAIEDARECDPFVRRWFSLLTDMTSEEPTVLPSGTGKNRRSTLAVEWVLGADNTTAPLPELTLPPALPVRRVNRATKVLELLEAPEVVPYGVARVTVEVDGKATFSGLVPFAEAVEGGLPVRKAELWLAEAGIPVGPPSTVELFIVPATDDNLAEFPLTQVRKLAQDYAGNFDATDAIRLLISRRQQEEGHK